MKKFISLMLGLLVMYSCQDEQQIINEYGQLNISVDVNDDIHSSTRFVDPSLNDYTIVILRSDAQQWKGDYATFTSTDLIFPALSDYRIFCENCTLDEAESANNNWGQLRLAGMSSQFSVFADQPNFVSITCTVQNTLISVDYQDTFKEAFTDYTIKVWSDLNPNRVLIYPSEATLESHVGYFNTSGMASTVYYEIEGTYNNTVKRFKGYLNTETAKHYRLRINVAASEAPKETTRNTNSEEDIMINVVL